MLFINYHNLHPKASLTFFKRRPLIKTSNAFDHITSCREKFLGRVVYSIDNKQTLCQKLYYINDYPTLNEGNLIHL